MIRKIENPGFTPLVSHFPGIELVIVNPVSVGQWPTVPVFVLEISSERESYTTISEIINNTNCSFTCNIWIVKIRLGGNLTPSLSFIIM